MGKVLVIKGADFSANSLAIVDVFSEVELNALANTSAIYYLYSSVNKGKWIATTRRTYIYDVSRYQDKRIRVGSYQQKHIDDGILLNSFLSGLSAEPSSYQGLTAVPSQGSSADATFFLSGFCSGIEETGFGYEFAVIPSNAKYLLVTCFNAYSKAPDVVVFE